MTSLQYALAGIAVWAGLSALCNLFWGWFFRRALLRPHSNYVQLPTWPGMLALPLATVPLLLFEFVPWMRQRATIRCELRQMRTEAEEIRTGLLQAATQAGATADELRRITQLIEAEIAKIDRRLERL